MLFDLRSRGRRRTVRIVYGGLALLMFVGLVGVGVGAGNGFGGILNAFSGNGSTTAQKAVINQQEQQALRATQANPSDAAAWGQLLQARWTTAGEGSNYDTATGTYTASGKRELTGATQAWARYVALVKSADPSLAVLAARAYALTGDYAGAANAWESETEVTPSAVKGFECLAITSYAAKQNRKGDLAAAKAVSMLPKAQQTTAKQTLATAKSSTSTATQLAAQC